MEFEVAADDLVPLRPQGLSARHARAAAGAAARCGRGGRHDATKPRGEIRLADASPPVGIELVVPRVGDGGQLWVGTRCAGNISPACLPSGCLSLQWCDSRRAILVGLCQGG